MRAIILSLIPLLHSLSASAQGKESVFLSDFNHVATVYEENIKPYLREFAEKQYSEKERTNHHLVDATYKIYLQKTEHLRKESLETLREQNQKNAKEMDKKTIAGYFDLLYRNQFTGLDYKFFEKSMKEAQLN